MAELERPDYGVDAPGAIRNLFLFGGGCLLLFFVVPNRIHVATNIEFLPRPALVWTGAFLILEGLLFLLYVKFGKFRHRDFMLAMHAWRGDEQVLDVGCGRGLLLAGAAKRLEALQGDGRVTGIDIWSNTDMGGNSEAATRHNLELEGASARCTLVSEPAQTMSFPDDSFDLIVSNLCLHNIYDKPSRLLALEQIVRVLKPGGEALISDYKRTAEYAAGFQRHGLVVERRWGSWLTTFPPLRVVVARKPLGAA